MKTLRSLLLPAIVSLSLISAPMKSFAGDTAEDKQEVEGKSKGPIFSNYSVLTNFNTYQLNVEGGVRKTIDLAFGFSFAVNEGEDDYLLNIRVSKEKKIGKKELIIPYAMLQGSLKYSRDKGELNQENISFGLKTSKNLSNKLGLGFDVRWIDYFNRKRNNELVAGIFISTNP